jgi:uncharacterized protein HemX
VPGCDQKCERGAKDEPLLTTTEGEIEGVKYDRVGVVLINAVQKQQSQIEALEKHNQAQQKQLECQQKQIDGLKQIVCSINPWADTCKKEKDQPCDKQSTEFLALRSPRSGY